MILDAIFNSNKTHVVTFTTTQSTEVDGMLVDSTDVEILSTRCIAYRGSISNAYKSDRFSADVSATLILRPSDVTTTIPVGAIANVDGFGRFSVMFVDDVAGQGLAVVVPCKELS